MTLKKIRLELSDHHDFHKGAVAVAMIMAAPLHPTAFLNQKPGERTLSVRAGSGGDVRKLAISFASPEDIRPFIRRLMVIER